MIGLQYWFDFCHTSAWMDEPRALQSEVSQKEKNAYFIFEWLSTIKDVIKCSTKFSDFWMSFWIFHFVLDMLYY